MSAEDLIASDKEFVARSSSITFTREHILAGHCRVLEPIAQAELRQAVAEYFEIHTACIYIVGSSKLGYSISPNKCFKPFNDESDIDIAVVQPDLFQRYWLQMYKAKQEMVDWPNLSSARNYLFKGWIRPDKLPLLDIRNKWFDFFNDLQARRVGGPFAVRGGLYFNVDFLESYQLNGVRRAFPES